MKLTTTAFESGRPIPARFTCDGADVNPPLTVEDAPEQAQAMVLIVDDPDAPNGVWLHWLVYDIVPRATIEQDSIPGIQGVNDFGKTGYGGPCPPSGRHRYYFRLYALDEPLGLPPGTGREQVEQAMHGHIVAETELMGTYERP